MVVYRITNILNGKIYIGRTVQKLQNRWTRHKYDCFTKKLDFPLYRAMRKYGLENFIIEEIDKANTLKELNKKEADWIFNTRSMVYQRGYNIKPEDDRLNMPKEIKNKISNSLKGKKKTYNICKKERSEIARKNGSKLKYDNEWAIKNGSKPFKVYKAICKQKSKRNQPSIYEKGKYIGEWMTSTDCAKELKINSQHIRSCLVGNRKQHKGYIFERE